jgi:alcohol dehydrogenase
MDALVHAVEPYLSPSATPLSDALALQAVRLVIDSLPGAFHHREDRGAALGMGYASVLAGLAFSSADLGPVHDIAFVAEERHGLSHARACAILLPPVIERRLAGESGRYREIAQAMGRKVDGLSDEAAVRSVLDAVNELLSVLGLETDLARYGIDADELFRSAI